MSSLLSTTESDALRRDNRAFDAVFSGGLPALLQEIDDTVNAGAVGITAAAWDVDALAKDGGAFAVNADTTTGLTLGHRGGKIHVGTQVLTVAAGTIALSSSSTNYVEVTRAGIVQKTTTGFTNGNVPLLIVVTGAGSISSYTNAKALLSALPAAGYTGDSLSTAQKTRTTVRYAGTVSATGTVTVRLPSFVGKITGIHLSVGTTVTTSDTDYWTFSAVRKGVAGTGTTALLDATDANTTKTTGGSGLTAFVDRSATLVGTGANLETVANELLVLTATKSGSAANLIDLVVAIDVELAG